MSLNQTPAGERLHIAFFGRRNAGKSSVLNAVTDQDLAVVSDVKGTTTDPVYKAMELLPIGPVMMIDTPGLDDDTELGRQRVKKAQQVLDKTDVAVLVVDATEGLSAFDRELIDLLQKKEIPYLIVYNKSDITAEPPKLRANELSVSAVTKEGVEELKQRLAALGPTSTHNAPIVSDLVEPCDVVVLVTPIDASAPKGRLILPQQQTIRELLDRHAITVVTQVDELASVLEKLRQPPKLVITDSQAFKAVDRITPPDIPLTSFSILMARHKGLLEMAAEGIAHIDELRDGDRILIAEGCTHHRQCEDIGTVKIPRWLKTYTQKDLIIETSTGREFPDDLEKYALVIHCGGCMLNPKEVLARMQRAHRQNIPVTNFGLAIAFMHGILERSLGVFPDLKARLFTHDTSTE
ncbi:MAG: [FeFe] hydrogenase H-cluster maturation GTPase HydF [Saccharofermentanales bacterium]|jgi:[FeFe] hydrogenase H-cluster maturation GTPase HydF